MVAGREADRVRRDTAHEPATAPVYHDEKSGARHIRMLPFKSDADGLLDGVRKHLFVVDAAGGEAKQITRGDFDVNAPSWSPDGKRDRISRADRDTGRRDGAQRRARRRCARTAR